MEARAYLDTCIVSGLVKDDLAKPEAEALQRILVARKRGAVSITTSAVTHDELSSIPEEHRAPHELLYNLLDDVPAAPTHRTDSGLTLMGVGGGRREDPLLTQLRAILADEGDAQHVFQAARNGVEFLITADVRSFARHSEQLQELCGVRVVLPSQFVAIHSLP